MVRPSCQFLALAVVLSACGKPAQVPGSPQAAAAADDDGGPADKSASSDSTAASDAPGGDDTKRKAAPCSGFEIPDLLSVLSQAACVTGDANGDSKTHDIKDALEVTVVPDSPRIAPGATSNVTITFHNKGTTALPLDFVVDPEPRFDFEVYTMKGTRVDAPKGDPPPLPNDVANASPPDRKIARITLTEQGTAKLTLPFHAARYAWAPKDKAKGALPGQGYPKEPAGPLPKGKYILRVVTPLTGVFEGIDHEVSQPRVQIMVAPVR